MIIIATSGYAAEVAAIASSAGHSVDAVYGADGARGAAEALGLPYIDYQPDLAGLPEGPIALTLGHNGQRAEAHARLIAVDREVITLIHRDATIGPAVELGAGSLVSPGTRITANVTVGACALIHTGAVLSHDDVLGDYVTVSPSVTVCGGVTIEDHAWVAAGATLLPGVTIGAGAVVGAGALVTKDVPAGLTVAGVPAAPLGQSRAGRRGLRQASV